MNQQRGGGAGGAGAGAGGLGAEAARVAAGGRARTGSPEQTQLAGAMNTPAMQQIRQVSKRVNSDSGSRADISLAPFPFRLACAREPCDDPAVGATARGQQPWSRSNDRQQPRSALRIPCR